MHQTGKLVIVQLGHGQFIQITMPPWLNVGILLQSGDQIHYYSLSIGVDFSSFVFVALVHDRIALSKPRRFHNVVFAIGVCFHRGQGNEKIAAWFREALQLIDD